MCGYYKTMVNGHAMYYWLLIMGCIDILLVISGCPSSNIDIITLDPFLLSSFQFLFSSD
jgi:hypothetical protein